MSDKKYGCLILGFSALMLVGLFLTSCESSLQKTKASAAETGPLLQGAGPAEAKKADERSYKIQPGNTLSINVWRVPLLTQEVTVGPDGTFRYPLLGNVPAKGKTVEELGDHLTKALAKDYLKDPVVTVSLGPEAHGFFVVGEVNSPGSFPLKEKIDVYQAIITAGGFTDFASKKVKVIRKIGGGKKVIHVHIDKFSREGEADPDWEVQPGDVIVVSKSLL